MSLKVEQRLASNFFAESKPIIFTMGAFLVPMEISRNGKSFFVWVVEAFEDDTFKDGEIYNPREYGETIDKLLVDTTKE